MTSLETTLAEAIGGGDRGARIAAAHADAVDWGRVERTVALRARRRNAAFRVAVLGFLVLMTVAALGGLHGSGVDTAPDNAVPAQEAAAADTSIWPTAEDVAAQAGERPRSQTWLAWLVGFGVPLAMGTWAWLRAPAHLRFAVASQRWARLVLAAAVAVLGAVGLGIGLGVALVVWYDPLAAQTGASLLLSVLRVIRISLYTAVVVLAVAHQATRLAPGRSVWRAGSFAVGALGWAGLWLVPVSWVDFMVRGLGWHWVVGAAGPRSGLWGLVLSSNNVRHLDPSGSEIGAAGVVVGFVLVGAGAAVWICRSLIRAVLAGDRLGRIVWPTARRSRLGLALVIAGLLLPLLVMIGRDAHAQSVGHLVLVPADLEPAAGDVRVRRNIIADPFEDWALVEVSMEGLTSATRNRLDAVTDEQLLRPELGFVERGEGFWRQTIDGPQSGPTNREYWSIERADGVVTIRGERDPQSQSDLLNESLFAGALLLLAGTSRRLRGSDDAALVGRVAAGWFALGLSIWLFGGLVRSFIVVEELLAPFGGDPTIEQLDQATNLEVHRRWSPGVYVAGAFGFGAGALIPAAVLGLAALHRLTGRRVVVVVAAVAALVGVIEVERRWGLVIDVGNDLVE